MNRGERRDLNKRKWFQKLHKLFDFGYVPFVYPVKTSKYPKHNFYLEAKESDWRKLRCDKICVLFKNTRTLYSDKRWNMKETRKQKIANRKVSREILNQIDNDVSF